MSDRDKKIIVVLLIAMILILLRRSLIHTAAKLILCLILPG